MLFTCGVMFLHYIIALIIDLVKPFSYVAVSEGLVFLLHCKFPNQKKLDNLIPRLEVNYLHLKTQLVMQYEHPEECAMKSLDKILRKVDFHEMKP